MIKFGGIGLIVLIVGWSITKITYRAYKISHPPYLSPTIRYGLLPKIVFPDKKTEAKNFVFEFANDIIPSFPDQIKVYVIYRPNTTFLALAEDTKTAVRFGFNEAPVELKPGIYEFKNNSLNKTLTINVLTGDFEMTYPFTSDQLLLVPDKMPTKSEAIQIASNFLGAGGKLTKDLVDGEEKISFWKIENDGLKAVESQTDANVVRVDFFRSDLESYRLLSSEYNKTSISVLVSGSKTESKKIIGLNFKNIIIDRESFSTYPIKTGQEAVESMKSGNYWTAVDVTNKEITIRKMSLAYYQPNTLTNYLQPIYVFEGDNNFVAYVPAVKSEYMAN